MNSSTGQTHAFDMSLNWQTGKTKIAERAKHLLNSGLYTDCEFLVGTNGSNQELIKANKTFLGMSSPVFDKMFSGKMTEGAGVINQPISIPDLTPSSFKDLLMYMYSDSLDLQTMDQAMGLWEAAQKYILPDLVEKCILYVKENLCPQYTIRVLEFIKLFEDESIKEKCLSLLRERTLECLAASDFEDAHTSTVLTIVKEKVLNIRELELFNSVIRWAKLQCVQIDLAINGKNLRQILKEMINEIRFLIMTSEEFSSSPVLSGILSEKECLAIYQNINNPDSWPLPINLSSSRESRQSSLSSGSGGIRCLRRIENETRFLFEPNENIRVRLTADKDVMITGLIIANATPLSNQATSFSDLQLFCKVYEPFESLVASATVSHSSTSRLIIFNPIFDRPVGLKRDKQYIISIGVSRRAYFLSGTAPTWVSCQGQGVRFKFTSDDVTRNGIVRGVIFSPC